jgi:lipopolysaccharide export system permease protein
MRTLDRYIGRTVLSTIAMVLLIVIALQTFFSLIEEMNHLGRGDYTAIKVVEYILLTTPRKIYELFPLISLMGSLLGLGGLAAQNELTVIRSAGISVARIALATLKASLILLLISLVLGEVVVPPLERLAAQRKAAAVSGLVSPVGRGVWIRDQDQFLFLRHAIHPQLVHSLFRVSIDEKLRPVELVQAEQGKFEEGVWHLSEVVKTRFSDSKIEVEHQPEESWSSALTPSTLEWVATRPEMLSIPDLVRYQRYLERNQLHARRYELAFWSKIFAPIATLVMVLVGVPFALGSARSAHTGFMIFLGIVGGVSFYMLNRLFTNIAMFFPIPAPLGAALPLLLFALIGGWALLRRF